MSPQDRPSPAPPAAPPTEGEGRRPYEPPTIESEQILEKQLLVICGTFPQPCQQPPPQS